jgi:hypothetical protein
MIFSALTWIGGHVAITEVLWLSFGILGFFFAFINFRHAMRDIDLLNKFNHNGITKAMALAHMRTEGLRMLIHSISIAIGATAMMLPPNNPDRPVTALAVLITLGLFLINGITVLQSLLDARLRIVLTKEVEKELKEISRDDAETEKENTPV